jgi:flagellar biosynthesis protein FlhF
MEMQTFQANSMADALEKVKKALGSEAVILHTRTLRRGGVLGVGAKTVVEITASRDLNALNSVERRAIIGRTAERRGGERSIQPDAGRPAHRVPQVEGAPVSPPAGADPVFTKEMAAFGAALRGEMGELRAMVRQLLDRDPDPPRAAVQDLPDELREYYTNLIGNDVAEEIAQEVVTEARERLREWRNRIAESGKVDDSRSMDVYQRLRCLIPEVMVEIVERMIPPPAALQLGSTGRTRYVALVGPTGVGKTTTIAKLAAHFKLREGKRVGLITIDTYRIAAVEQIKAYADILGIPLEVVMTPEGMEAAVASLSDCDLVLIDTSGRSQRDADRLDELKSFLDVVREPDWQPGSPSVSESEVRGHADSSGGPEGTTAGSLLEVHLVLSCTAKPSQLLEVAERFAALGVNRVVFTKLDEAVGLGVILNVSRRLNLRLSYLTTGQDVPDDIEVGHRRRIAEMILGRRGGTAAPTDAGQRITPVIDHLV